MPIDNGRIRKKKEEEKKKTQRARDFVRDDAVGYSLFSTRLYKRRRRRRRQWFITKLQLVVVVVEDLIESGKNE